VPRPERDWRTLTPKEWCDGLLHIRAWSARRLDVEMMQAANDDRYFDEPPAVAVAVTGYRNDR
jgi:hypothetical protein